MSSWLNTCLIEKNPEKIEKTMKTFIIIVIVVIVVIAALALFIYSSWDKDAIPEDREVAKKLGLTTKRARLYREIFDEQLDCYSRGVEPPDRTNEIPNMNEWRLYGKYRESKYSVSAMYEKYMREHRV